jgi:hypothetical protein
MWVVKCMWYRDEYIYIYIYISLCDYLHLVHFNGNTWINLEKIYW